MFRSVLFFFCLNSLMLNAPINCELLETPISSPRTRIPSTDQAVERRFLMITGCARSGTTFIFDVLTECGLNLAQERVGPDGCVAWQTAVDVNYYAMGWKNFPNKKIEYDVVFHQVRDPLAVITSLYNISVRGPWELAWRYICNCIPEIKQTDSMLLKSAKYWVYWNLEAEKRAQWTYRLEDIDTVFDEMQSRLGMVLDRTVLDRVPRHTNHKQPTTDFVASWAILEKELPPAFFKKLKQLSIRYGYSVTDTE